MNLIEQQNILKGLTDESLQAELSTPSSGAPPFLIASEVSRRKSARERYEGAKAKAQPSTVMEDLMGGGMPSGVGAAIPNAMGQPQAPAGLAAALPTAGAMPEPQTAFAEGGLVGALDYDAIGQRYAETLDGLGERKDRARALALLQAGAGMLSGGSSNTLTNIGKGIAAGTTAYGGSLDQIDQDEQRALAGALDLARVQQGDELQRLQFDWTKDRAGQEDALTREGWAQNRTPASIQEFNATEAMTPDERKRFFEQNPIVNPNQVTNDMRAIEDANKAYDLALKAIPDSLTPPMNNEAALAAAREKQKQAALLAYPKWVTILGPEKAKAFAAQYGVTDGDILTGGASTGSMDGNDPLGLGL